MQESEYRSPAAVSHSKLGSYSCTLHSDFCIPKRFGASVRQNN